jgi:putative endonuclease
VEVLVMAYRVYIVTNELKKALYTGMTNDLCRRLREYSEGRGQGKHFSGKYRCYNLVYFEEFHEVSDAILREKMIKGWKRFKKLDLIRSLNPGFEFLLPP